ELERARETEPRGAVADVVEGAGRQRQAAQLEIPEAISLARQGQDAADLLGVARLPAACAAGDQAELLARLANLAADLLGAIAIAAGVELRRQAGADQGGPRPLLVAQLAVHLGDELLVDLIRQRADARQRVGPLGRAPGRVPGVVVDDRLADLAGRCRRLRPGGVEGGPLVRAAGVEGVGAGLEGSERLLVLAEIAERDAEEELAAAHHLAVGLLVLDQL